MSTHTSWKYYKNCVWTIIAWALLGESLTWDLDDVSVGSLVLAPTYGWLSPLATGRAQWPPVGSLCPPSSQPCQLWASEAADTPPAPPTVSHTGLCHTTHIESNLHSSRPASCVLTSAPLSWTWSVVISLRSPEEGDIMPSVRRLAGLPPPTKYWSGAGVSRHQGSASWQSGCPVLAQKCTFLQDPELGPPRTGHNWDTRGSLQHSKRKKQGLKDCFVKPWDNKCTFRPRERGCKR